MANKKKKSQINKINLKSLKNRIILLVASFALVGGGIFVYKSFAATNSWTYTIANNLLAVNNWSGSGCYANKVVEPSKNNSLVYSMSCPNYNGNSVTVYSVGSYGSKGIKYRACAWVKGSGEGQIYISGKTRDGYRDPYSTSAIGTMYNTMTNMNTSAYNYNCSNPITLSDNSSITAGVMATRLNSKFKLSAITIEQL